MWRSFEARHDSSQHQISENFQLVAKKLIAEIQITYFSFFLMFWNNNNRTNMTVGPNSHIMWTFLSIILNERKHDAVFKKMVFYIRSTLDILKDLLKSIIPLYQKDLLKQTLPLRQNPMRKFLLRRYVCFYTGNCCIKSCKWIK